MVLTLVLTGAGSTVFAQDDNATPATEEELSLRDAYLEALAAELGVTAEELETAMSNAELQMIDRWAQEARDRVAGGGSVLPGPGGSFGGTFGHFADGPRFRPHIQGGLMEPGIFMIPGRIVPGEELAGMAAFLGISEDGLQAGLESGMTLVEIAEANGKTYDDLRAYLIAQATERIDDRLQESTGETDDTTGTPEPSASLTIA